MITYEPKISLQYLCVYEKRPLPDPEWLRIVYPWEELGSFYTPTLVLCVDENLDDLVDPTIDCTVLRQVVLGFTSYSTVLIDGEEWRVQTTAPPTHKYGRSWASTGEQRYANQKSAETLDPRVTTLLFVRRAEPSADDAEGWRI